MNKLLNLLLRSSLSASLSDREVFTEKVAEVIEQKIGKDPQMAKKLSESLATAMDSMNEQLLFDQIFNPQSDNKLLEEKIDQLTRSIDRLNNNIEKLIEHGI